MPQAELPHRAPESPGVRPTGGLAGVGIFRQDTNWRPNGTVAFEIMATSPATSLAAEPQIDARAPRMSAGLGRVSATLTSSGTPVGPGEQITFTVGSTTLCTATTNPSGVATCSLTLKNELKVLVARSYTASFAGNSGYAASTASTPAIVF